MRLANLLLRDIAGEKCAVEVHSSAKPSLPNVENPIRSKKPPSPIDD